MKRTAPLYVVPIVGILGVLIGLGSPARFVDPPVTRTPVVAVTEDDPGWTCEPTCGESGRAYTMARIANCDAWMARETALIPATADVLAMYEACIHWEATS